MRYAYVTALIDFRISGELKAPLKIKENLFLTNNPEHIARYTNPSHLVTIGTLEARLLTDGSPVVYKLDKLRRREDAPAEVINFLREVQGLLMAAWLEEDNSVNCELAFAFSQEFMHVHSNALALNYSTHDGSRKQMEVDEDGARRLAEMHRKFFQGIRVQDHPEHTAFRKTIARLDRAIRFLQQARSSDDLGQKIANYCSFFEALLSTSSAELSHQLSERAAFFLSNSPSERLRLFREIKKAYGIRSKIVHGDILSTSAIASLVDIAGSCDRTARALMLKIILDPDLSVLMNDGSNDAIDTYMLDLIFGVRSAASVISHGKASDA
jgi:hypothetical protein